MIGNYLDNIHVNLILMTNLNSQRKQLDIVEVTELNRLISLSNQHYEEEYQQMDFWLVIIVCKSYLLLDVSVSFVVQLNSESIYKDFFRHEVSPLKVSMECMNERDSLLVKELLEIAAFSHLP